MIIYYFVLFKYLVDSSDTTLKKCSLWVFLTKRMQVLYTFIKFPYQYFFTTIDSLIISVHAYIIITYLYSQFTDPAQHVWIVTLLLPVCRYNCVRLLACFYHLSRNKAHTHISYVHHKPLRSPRFVDESMSSVALGTTQHPN